ncbi:hypothetical protein ATCC90586_000532 [Pythium insidiosum]|nr:hypothetical protein ATCC90586_000532 [Pythium insidiosum]
MTARIPLGARLRASVIVALALTALTITAAATIDKELKLDGATTYCHGVRKAQDPLAMDAVNASSADRCPVSIKLSPSALAVNVREPLDLHWRATINVVAMKAGFFPNAIDAKSKLPRDVVTSVLRACKAGSNCVGAGSVVIPAVVGPADAERGAFDDQGRKPLRAHRFVFPSAGEYVVVGQVMLPGDSALDISATVFLAFQRVTVTAGVPDLAVMGTVGPSSSHGSADDIVASDADGRTNLRFKSPAQDATTPPASSGIDAEFHGKAQPKTGAMTNTIVTVVGAVGGVLAIAALVFVFVSRQRRKADDDAAAARKFAPTKPPHAAPGEIYRLDFSLDDAQPPAKPMNLAPVSQFPRFSIPSVSAAPPQTTAPTATKQESWGTFSVGIDEADAHSVRRSSVSTSQFNDSQYGGLGSLASVADLHDDSPSSGRTSSASSFASDLRGSSRLFLSEITVKSVALPPTATNPAASYLRDTSEFHVRFSERESEDDDSSVFDADDSPCASQSSIYSY